MNEENYMSTNVEDLNDMQMLSSSIENDIDNNNIKKIFSSDDLTKLQELQKQQIEQIQKMEELKEKIIEENKIENYEEPEDEDNLLYNIYKFIQDPLILFIIFFLISYDPIIQILKNIIPNMEGDSIISIITRGTIFISLYSIIKFFL